jgi:light-harvesting protein B-800-850 alpha chain
MFQDVFNYKPKEQDYRIWLVVNPATWLIPILMSVFVLGILIHAFLFSVSPYGGYWGGEEAAAAPAVEEAAPAAPVAAPAG